MCVGGFAQWFSEERGCIKWSWPCWQATSQTTILLPTHTGWMQGLPVVVRAIVMVINGGGETELTLPSAKISATVTMSSRDWSSCPSIKSTLSATTLDWVGVLVMLNCSTEPKETLQPKTGAPAANIHVTLTERKSETTSEDCSAVVTA